MRTRLGWLGCILLAVLLIEGCAHEVDPRDAAGRRILRVGYLPNLTHAPALLGLQSGLFADRLGADAVVEATAFRAGPSVVEALFAGELDVAYLGPNPAINAFVRSRGTAVRIIAGCTSGGAAFIAQPGIRGAADLVGRKVASPAIANTQDISLRTWLKERGFRTVDAGGQVDVVPVSNPDIFSLFQRDRIAAAWVAEPWSSRLLLEAGGRVLVDERTLWPRGVYPTTELIASTAALRARPDLVARFVGAHREAVRLLEEEPAYARPRAVAWVKQTIRLELPPAVTERAFSQLAFTTDPLEAELATLAQRAADLGYLPRNYSIEGIVDRRFLR